jgi:hypothetical protein
MKCDELRAVNGSVGSLESADERREAEVCIEHDEDWEVCVEEVGLGRRRRAMIL